MQMFSFYEWLRDFRHHLEPDVEKLAERVRQSPEIYNLVEDLDNARQSIDGDGAIKEKEQYKEWAVHAWTEFTEFREKLEARARGEGWSWWSPMIQAIVVTTLAVVILGSLATAMFYGPFRESLARVEIARGILTLFFGMGTVGVALILVTAAFTSQKPDAGPRFDMGKQVLTALIGVFGVIVGFYFGTELAETATRDEGAGQQVASPLGEELIYLVRRTEDALEGITDDTTAKTAASTLEELDTRIQKLSEAVDALPKEAKIELADDLQDAVAELKGLAYDVTAQEDIGQVVRPKLAPIMANFENWSQPR